MEDHLGKIRKNKECDRTDEFPKRRRLRGIRNRTGTACHMNAAFVVMAYCLDFIPKVIDCRENEGNPCDTLLMDALMRLLRNLRHPSTDESFSSSDEEEPVDPTELYNALKNASGTSKLLSDLLPDQCGDAVVSLIRWLQWLRSIGDAAGSPKPRWLDPFLYSGRMYSVLNGVTSETSMDAQSCERRKVLKEGTLTNPFPLSITPTTTQHLPTNFFLSLPEALTDALCTEQPLMGYQWSGGDAKEVTTTKRCHVTRWPPIFMIHLAKRQTRFDETSDSIQIPYSLDGSSYLSSEDAAIPNGVAALSEVFHLRGGILHISHREDGGEESIGHYVAVISIPTKVDPPEWYVIDDEKVLSVSIEQVLRWLAGDLYSIEPDDDESYARGILLVYHREDLLDVVDSLYDTLFGKSEPNDDSAYLQPGCNSKKTSVYGDSSSWDPQNDFSSIDNTTERRVGASPEQFCAQGIHRLDPETGQCVVTYEEPNLVRAASPVLQKSVEWRRNNYVNKDTASSVTLETHVGELNDGSKRSSAEEHTPDEACWVGRRLRVLWSGGIFHEGCITHFDSNTGQHTIVYRDGDIRQYHLSKTTFHWLSDEEKSCVTPPSAKVACLWLDDSDVSDNDDDA